MAEKDAPALFDNLDEFSAWWDEWQGMPEFVCEDLTAYTQVIVNFENRAALEAFATLVGQKLTLKTRSIWYPEAEIGHLATKRYADES